MQNLDECYRIFIFGLNENRPQNQKMNSTFIFERSNFTMISKKRCPEKGTNRKKDLPFLQDHLQVI